MYSSENLREFSPESEIFESEQFEFSASEQFGEGAFSEAEATELALEPVDLKRR